MGPVRLFLVSGNWWTICPLHTEPEPPSRPCTKFVCSLRPVIAFSKFLFWKETGSEKHRVYSVGSPIVINLLQVVISVNFLLVIHLGPVSVMVEIHLISRPVVEESISTNPPPCPRAVYIL